MPSHALCQRLQVTAGQLHVDGRDIKRPARGNRRDMGSPCLAEIGFGRDADLDVVNSFGRQIFHMEDLDDRHVVLLGRVIDPCVEFDSND